MSLKQTFKIYIKHYNGIPISMYKLMQKHENYSLCQEMTIQNFLLLRSLKQTKHFMERRKTDLSSATFSR